MPALALPSHLLFPVAQAKATARISHYPVHRIHTVWGAPHRLYGDATHRVRSTWQCGRQPARQGVGFCGYNPVCKATPVILHGVVSPE